MEKTKGRREEKIKTQRTTSTARKLVAGGAEDHPAKTVISRKAEDYSAHSPTSPGMIITKNLLLVVALQAWREGGGVVEMSQVIRCYGWWLMRGGGDGAARKGCSGEEREAAASCCSL